MTKKLAIMALLLLAACGKEGEVQSEPDLVDSWQYAACVDAAFGWGAPTQGQLNDLVECLQEAGFTQEQIRGAGL